MAMIASPPRAHRLLGVDPYGLAMVAALLALLVGGAWAAMTTVINHDSAWYLHATKLLLHGGRLYEDIIEVNPPLAFYLTVPPVWLAEVTGVSAVDLFFIYVFGLTAVSLILIWAVLRAFPELSLGAQRGLLVASFFAVVLSTWQQIGQREHFLLIFVMPYLFLAGARISGGQHGRGLAVTVGGFAALGFALKPHFLLVPAAVELYRFVRTRNIRQALRPEVLALGGLVVAYAISVVLFTPAYLTRILPWATEVYYAYARSLPDVLILGLNEALLLFVAAGLFFCIRTRSPERAIAAVFLVASAAFYVIYAVQMKGWNYHRFPVIATALVALSTCLILSLRRTSSPGLVRRPIFVLVALGWLGWSAVWLLGLGSYRNPFLERGLAAVSGQARGTTLAVLSTNVWQAYPLANYAGLETISRFSTLWLLPGAMRQLEKLPANAPAAKRETLHAIEQYTIDAVIEDFERHAPDLVIVDVRESKPYFEGRSFDYIAYLSEDPRFAALWPGYERIGDLGGYDLYRRRAADEAPGGRTP